MARSLLMAALALLPGVAAAQCWSQLGIEDTPDGALDVLTWSDQSLVADGSGGLQILDVSDPTDPTIIDSIDTPGFAQSLAWNVTFSPGDVYVANGSVGVCVVGGFPGSPSIIGGVDTPGFANDVAVLGDLLFVADSTAGLQVMDITDSTMPELIGGVDTPGDALGVAPAPNDRVVLAAGFDGLIIVDVSDPTMPFVCDEFATPGFAFDVAVSGNTAYVADGDTGLLVVNVSIIGEPSILGTLDTPGFASRVDVVGLTAIVGDENGGVTVADVSDPSAPAMLTEITTDGLGLGTHLASGKLYVAESFAGLGVYDVIGCPTPGCPERLGVEDVGGDPRWIGVDGDRAYVCSKEELFVVDVADPSTPTVIGMHEIVDPAVFIFGVAASGDICVVSDLSRLRVFDVSGAQPVELAVLGTDEFVNNLAMAGDLVYAATDLNGLTIFDVSDPLQPFVVSTTSSDAMQVAYSIELFGDIAIVGGTTDDVDVDVIVAFDVGDAADPVELGCLHVPGSSTWPKPAAEGSTAYVTSGRQMFAVDISDPEEPSIIGDLPLPVEGDIDVEGNRAYVTGPGGFLVVDVADPTEMAVVASYVDADYGYRIGVQDKIAYLIQFMSKLDVVDVSECAACAPDINGDGVLNILDFVAFQVAFVAGDPIADCDANGVLNIIDFVCFQTLFQAGCL